MSFLGKAGSAVGSVFGSIGGGVAEGAGATSGFQATNPYNESVLQNELKKQAEIYSSQRDLASALVGQMQGTGPNPAQTQFLMNQQSNLANAQGLIASQRGLNPALAARMGSNASVKANQDAGLGAALLQQQQQLQATNALGNVYGQMQAGNLGQQQLYNQANLGTAGMNQQTMAQNAAVRGQVTGSLMNSAGSAATAGAGGAAHGALVKGKAKVQGDSPENDTVPIMAPRGEIVIPRSKANDPEKAKEFVAHLLKENGKKSDSKKSEYTEVLKYQKIVKDLEKRISSLEKKKA